MLQARATIHLTNFDLFNLIKIINYSICFLEWRIARARAPSTANIDRALLLSLSLAKPPRFFFIVVFELWSWSLMVADRDMGNKSG
jgi:hypothetical protein